MRHNQHKAKKLHQPRAYPKLIYIIGPMRGLPQYNYPLFDMVAQLYRLAGYKVASPADSDRRSGFKCPRKADWSKWPAGLDRLATIRRSVNCVLLADVIVALPWSSTSEGARVETQLATWAKKPMIEFREEICGECAGRMGAKGSGHVVTMWTGICPFCFRERGLCALSDYHWPKGGPEYVWD